MSEQESVEIFKSWNLYDNIVRNNWMCHQQMADFIRKAAYLHARPADPTSSPKKLRILDLGCGDGAMARNGLAGIDIESYIGIDLSQDALNLLTQSSGLGPNPRTIHGDLFESIKKLPSESQDVILASYSLHHFHQEQKESILTEVRRVLSQHGCFLWIDIACLEEEDRSGYVSRIEHDIHTQWKPMPAQDAQDAIEHIRNYDFPEKASWMIHTWSKICNASSFEQTDIGQARVGYRDAFYIALQLT